MLQERITQELHNRDIECTPCGTSAVQVNISDREVFISLENLLRSMVSEGVNVDMLIQEFVDNVMGWIHQSSRPSTVYPRVLSTPEIKPLSHPWTQSFLGKQLEIGLVQHSQGRISFLTPLQVLKQQGGLKGAKSRAVDSLRNLLPQVEVDTLGDRIWSIHHPEILTSSLVLFLDRFTQLCDVHTVQFAIPSRGTLYFSSNSLLPVEHHIISECNSEPYPISPIIFQVSLEHVARYRQSWSLAP